MSPGKKKNMQAVAQQDDLTSSISPLYTRFFEKLKEIDKLDVKEWNTNHVIGYFCKKYRHQYNMDYSFRFNQIPSKSYEVFQVKRLASMLSTNPVVLKDYIDWLFEKKVVERKRKITSIGFLSTIELVNEYKFKVLMPRLNGQEPEIKRTDELPPSYLLVLQNANISVTTYGDLTFLKKAMENDEQHKVVFEKLALAVAVSFKALAINPLLNHAFEALGLSARTALKSSTAPFRSSSSCLAVPLL